MAARGQARTFNNKSVDRLLSKVLETSAQPEVMRATFLLSFYAGLRVQEIAGLEWDRHVFNAGKEFYTAYAPLYDSFGDPVYKEDGDMEMQPVPALSITSDIGKYGKKRKLPLHPDLKKALKKLRKKHSSGKYVIPSGRCGAQQTLKQRTNALRMRINRLYRDMGYDRATSHSGRRSFITRAAQRANAYKTSLNDVRDLAGHASLLTTQNYVDPSPHQSDLVNNIWT